MKRNIIFLASAMLFLLTAPVFAAGELGPIDAVIKAFETAMTNSGLEDKLIGGAKVLFFSLATIQIAWTVGMEILAGAGTLQSVVACIVRQTMHVAFFYMLLVPTKIASGRNILGVIVDSIQGMAVTLSGVSDFGTIFSMGVSVTSVLWTKIGDIGFFTDPGTKIGSLIVGGLCTVVILLSFALASLTVVIALCRTYLATSICVFYLGFGGSTYTKDIALSALRASFMAGMELFTIYVLAGVGTTLFDIISNTAGTGVNEQNIFSMTFSLTIASIIFAGALRTLPGYVSGIISGSSGSVGGGPSLMGALGTAALIGSAGAAGIGGMAGGVIGGYHGSAVGGGAGGVLSILKGVSAGMYSGSKGGFQQMFREAGMNALHRAKPPTGTDNTPNYNNITGAPNTDSNTGAAQHVTPPDSPK